MGRWPIFYLLVEKMRAASRELQKLVESVVSAMGYELVGLEHLSRAGSALIRIYIDQASGITLNDCEKVSHQVSGVFEVEDPISGPYTLEVSSPGLDRPLFNAAQFARFVGHDARVRLQVPVQNRRNFRGTILAVNGEEVRMAVDGVEFALQISDVETANLVPHL